jgi:hypothetical protein
MRSASLLCSRSPASRVRQRRSLRSSTSALVSKPLRRRLKSYSGSGRAPLLPAAPRHLAPTREWGESAEAGAAIGYAHIDVCELRVAQGKLFMFLVINRISKFTHAAFHEASTKLNGAAFLRQVVEVLYRPW